MKQIKKSSPLRVAFLRVLRATIERQHGDTRAVAAELGASLRTTQRWIAEYDLRAVVERAQRASRAA